MEAKNKNITLNLNCSDNLPTLIADKKRLKQVLFYLINNAVSAAFKDGAVSLSVYTENKNLVISLDGKEGEENEADHAMIGYKLTDDEGFVAESGTIYTKELRVGEKTKEEERVYRLDPSKTYTLTLEDPK